MQTLNEYSRKKYIQRKSYLYSSFRSQSLSFTHLLILYPMVIIRQVQNDILSLKISIRILGLKSVVYFFINTSIIVAIARRSRGERRCNSAVQDSIRINSALQSPAPHINNPHHYVHAHTLLTQFCYKISCMEELR